MFLKFQPVGSQDGRVEVSALVYLIGSVINLEVNKWLSQEELVSLHTSTVAANENRKVVYEKPFSLYPSSVQKCHLSDQVQCKSFLWCNHSMVCHALSILTQYIKLFCIALS